MLRASVCAAAIAAVVSLGVTVTRSEAFSGGIFDVARPSQGCTCHASAAPPSTVTQLLICGLPNETGISCGGAVDTGYTPGASYDLTVWVLGPMGAPTQIRGFNLDASAGSLAPTTPGDQTVQTVVKTECQLRQSVGGCNPATTCGVKGESLCRTLADCFTRRCTTPGTGDCRLCSDTLVYIQATHTATGGTPPVELFTDGNSVAYWSLTWTAPDPGVGDVTFYMAGNAVNGTGSPDLGDFWSVLDPGMIVPQQ